MFFSHFLFEITIQNYHGQRNWPYLKYDFRKWPYPYLNTNFVIALNLDISLQNQRYSASDASVGANDVSPYELYQSTNHHDNTDGKDNDYSRSYKIPRKNDFCSSSSGGNNHHDNHTTISHTSSTWKIISIISNLKVNLPCSTM